MGDSFVEEPLEILADIKLSSRQENALATKAANSIPHFCDIACQLGKWLSPCAQHLLGCLKYWVPAQFGPSNKEDTNKLDWVQHVLLAGQHSPCQKRLREAELLPPAAGMTSGGEGSSPQHLQEGHKENGGQGAGQEITGIVWNNKHMARYKKKTVSWWRHVQGGYATSMVTDFQGQTD